MQANIEDIYQRLVRDGNNTVDHIVRWLRDSGVLEKTQKTEKDAYQLLADVADRSQVTYEQFHAVVLQLTKQQQKSAEHLFSMLCEESSKYIKALNEAAMGFQEKVDRKTRHVRVQERESENRPKKKWWQCWR